MDHLPVDTLNFLADLMDNNNRDWFKSNKSRYEQSVKEPWEAFVSSVIDTLSGEEETFGRSAKQSVFRIYRDTRFSKDKTPYKTHISASLASPTRKAANYAGYYMQVGAGGIMIGGGAYWLEKDPLYALRERIKLEPQRITELTSEPSFKERYGELQGERNKRLPKEFREVQELQPLILNKQMYYMSELPPDVAVESGFKDVVLSHFRAARPVNAYLNQAIGKT